MSRSAPSATPTPRSLTSARNAYLKKGPGGLDNSVLGLDSVKNKLANW